MFKCCKVTFNIIIRSEWMQILQLRTSVAHIILLSAFANNRYFKSIGRIWSNTGNNLKIMSKICSLTLPNICEMSIFISSACSINVVYYYCILNMRDYLHRSVLIYRIHIEIKADSHLQVLLSAVISPIEQAHVWSTSEPTGLAKQSCAHPPLVSPMHGWSIDME